MRSNLYAALLLCCATLLPGCGALNLFGGTEVKSVKTVAEPPSDITVYVTVSDHNEPVAGLSEHNFKIYENDVLLGSKEIGLRLLSRDQVAAGYTVLLLDLSGGPTDPELNRIERGATHFVEKVTTTQPVIVVAFDGTARAREVARYSKVDAPVKRDVPPLQPFMSKDTSRDLNNALISAISGVKQELAKQSKEGVYGTVVTMTRGPDLAGRRTDAEVRKAVHDSGFQFFSITPENVKIPTLGNFGKDAKFEYATIDTLPMRFTDLGMRVRDTWNSHYLLHYCSPSRAGERKLRVKVNFENNGSKKSGSDSSKFDSTGFDGGCAISQSEAEAAEAEVEPSSPSEGASQASQPNQAKPAPLPKKAGAAPDDEDDGEVVAPPSTGKYE